MIVENNMNDELHLLRKEKEKMAIRIKALEAALVEARSDIVYWSNLAPMYEVEKGEPERDLFAIDRVLMEKL